VLTTAPRGTVDILPAQVTKFQHVENVFRTICRQANFHEIRTPMFEHSELFNRAVGEQTDIVQKEMYTFLDRSERSLTLRAEGTAPVARAFIEHGVYAQAQPTKYYYIAQIFRYEKPQQGRLRQHQQCGVEYFGSRHPYADVEVISLAYRFYRQLGLRQFDLLINTIGCPECRPAHRQALAEFLASRLQDLCPDCQSRYERNPMRILDCKQESCQALLKDAPTPIDYVCPSCAEHYQSVKDGLTALGIEFKENPRMVRGLDYYTNTAFEFYSYHIGAQGAIGGGGRYDGLVESCGGPATPGVGFGIGTERLILALEAEGVPFPAAPPVDVFIAALGSQAEAKALTLLAELRQADLVAEFDLMGRGLKAQMKQASRLGAKRVVVLGDNELERGVAVVRNMSSGDQTEVALSELVSYLR
jgi:histidyl-tRNA synthetase